MSLDVATLTSLLQETEKGHAKYESTNPPKHHWSGWYGAYLAARLQGKGDAEASADAVKHVEGAPK